MTQQPRLVSVAAYTSVHEAQLAQSVLEAAGIPTLLANEHVISMNWTYSNAVGGVRVAVPADRIDEARELLTTEATLATEADPPADDASDSNASDSCRRCGSDEFDSMLPGKPFSVLTWLTLGVPLGPFVRRRYCRRCGAAAEREEASS